MIALPGFSGHLISQSFLETALTEGWDEPRRTAMARGREAIVRWRRSGEWLGPASTVQTLWHTAAVPLVNALGFERPTAVEHIDSVLAGTIRAGAHPVVLLVAPWDARLHALWRVAVTQAMRRSAVWSLLFNGTHLRIVDAGRLYARRFVDFDIDLALGYDRAFQAFWTLLHVSAFSGETGAQSRLQTLVEASHHHAVAVSQSLREGVLTASAAILRALLNTNRARGTSTSVG
ncbi:MAG: hypothetical protein C5B57_02665, partial [Blastocatellia bacterium]